MDFIGSYWLPPTRRPKKRFKTIELQDLHGQENEVSTSWKEDATHDGKKSPPIFQRHVMGPIGPSN